MRPVEASSGSRGYEAVLGADLNLFDYPAGDYSIRLVSGAQVENSFGDSRPIQDEVASLLGDGEVTSTSRYGNKELVFCVEVSATDHAGLAAGEARLMDELDRVNTLTWAGPVGPRSVFEIVRSWSDFLFEDLEDVRCRRQYRVTLEVLPFVRSEKPITFTWTGPTRLLSLVESGWNQITPAGARLLMNYEYGDSVGIRVGPGAARLVTIETVAPVLIDGYFLHVVTRFAVGSRPTPRVWIGGELIPTAKAWVQTDIDDSDVEQVVVDVTRWRGTEQVVRVEFTDGGGVAGRIEGLNRLCWSNYPNAIGLDVLERGTADIATLTPLGIDVIEVEGTARTGLLIEFDVTESAATPFQVNAIVYTAPNPRAALRDRGAPEVGWGVDIVTNPDGEVITYDGIDTYLPQGTNVGALWTTSGQPPQLYPDGIWSEYKDGAPGADFAYPSDDRSAVSLTAMTEPTSVTLLSPSVESPSGLTEGGTFRAHEPHHLHPRNSGFAVMTTGQSPIPCTVTYYPRWRHHAAL